MQSVKARVVVLAQLMNARVVMRAQLINARVGMHAQCECTSGDAFKV